MLLRAVDGGYPEVPGLASLQESLSPPPSGHPALRSHHGRLRQACEEEEVDGEENCGDEIIAGHYQHPRPLNTNRGLYKQNRVSFNLRFLKCVFSYLLWFGLSASSPSSPAQWMAQLLDTVFTELELLLPGTRRVWGSGGGGWWVHRTSYFRWVLVDLQGYQWVLSRACDDDIELSKTLKTSWCF